jgi:hypothetical protein
MINMGKRETIFFCIEQFKLNLLSFDLFSVTEADAIAPSFLKANYRFPSTDLDLPKAPSVAYRIFH